MKIKFRFITQGRDKVCAIKQFRAASGLGLKEAKDAIDANWESGAASVEVIFNQAQFGRLMAEILINTNSEISICGSPQLYSMPVVADFSHLAPRSPH